VEEGGTISKVLLPLIVGDAHTQSQRQITSRAYTRNDPDLFGQAAGLNGGGEPVALNRNWSVQRQDANA